MLELESVHSMASERSSAPTPRCKDEGGAHITTGGGGGGGREEEMEVAVLLQEICAIREEKADIRYR